MADIPIVDFAKAIDGTKDEKEAVAKAIDNAFQNMGFVYLKNHSVPLELVEECFTWVRSPGPTLPTHTRSSPHTITQSKKFFALPHSTKILAPHPPGGSHHRGYSAPGVEKVSQHEYDANELAKARDVPEFKESFESGNIDDDTQPNIWLPDNEIPGFRAFMEKYFTHCARLVHRILDSLSIALNVPSPGLTSTHSNNLFQLRLLHYPAIATHELTNNKRSRINAHSDFGTLTLLFQDAIGGLEIEDPHQQGIFRPAHPITNTVLVNVGDLMERWSNDRWRSTVHRVGSNTVTDDADGVVPDRYSIPFFATPDMETVVEALPGCWGEGRPKRYGAVTAWGYVQMRMAALYEG